MEATFSIPIFKHPVSQNKKILILLLLLILLISLIGYDKVLLNPSITV